MSSPDPFQYVQPSPEQVAKIQEIRLILHDAADVLVSVVPAGPYRTLAYRKLEEASMWANKAIVFDGGSTP